MHTAIIVMLAMSALYCGATWLAMAVLSVLTRSNLRSNEELRREFQAYTFQVGLCFILSAGFLGLIWGAR